RLSRNSSPMSAVESNLKCNARERSGSRKLSEFGVKTRTPSALIRRCCFGCFAHHLRLRREVDHALRIGLGTRGIVHAPLYVQQRCALLGVEMATPYHCFFRADKSWNDQVSDPL